MQIISKQFYKHTKRFFSFAYNPLEEGLFILVRQKNISKIQFIKYSTY